jgi:CBS domain-containing protein
MKVDRVYTRSVVATTRDAPISQAASAMRRFHVGALLVVGEEPEDRDVIGIVTDRDLALRAVADGLLPDDVRVCEVMTSDVIAVREDADLREALERMRSAGVRRLLVQHANGDAAGILSLDDVVDGLAEDLASLARVVKSELRDEAGRYGGRH